MLDKNRPICPQICEQICVRIARDEWKPHEKLLSVREVAQTAGVNPNTVQKAFKMLEEKGLIYSEPSSGWFVGENREEAVRAADELIGQKITGFFAELRQLGLNEEQIKDYIGRVQNG